MEEVGTVVHFRNDGSVKYRIVIAGPDGAGKATFARRHPPGITLV
jgi:GTPase SAR1 family protein